LNPYSHLVIASHIAPRLGPMTRQDYYWGAIAPDIRYIAGMRREETHIPTERIQGLIQRYPHLRSFLRGYLVHILTDEINLEEVFYPRFPFSVLKRRLTRQHLAVILEFFYIEREVVNPEIAGTCNDVLCELGLNEDNCTKFARFMNHYTSLSSLDARVAGLTQLLGLENDPRIEKYAAAAKNFEARWLLKNVLFLGIRLGKVNTVLVSQVSAKLKAIPELEATPDAESAWRL
jgi:hypothetical protein